MRPGVGLRAIGGELAFQFENQFINTLNQRGAQIGLSHDPGGCSCARVVFAQTIKVGTDPVRIDVDPGVTGVDTPFYNYDPAATGRVPAGGLGGPGDCSGRSDATLRDRPVQSTSPVIWEVCAICCDDGRILDCRQWRYDPTADRGTTIDGQPVRGKYFDDGRIGGFSPAARTAYAAGLRAYVQRNPTTAADPCVKNLLSTLAGP